MKTTQVPAVCRNIFSFYKASGHDPYTDPQWHSRYTICQLCVPSSFLNTSTLRFKNVYSSGQIFTNQLLLIAISSSDVYKPIISPIDQIDPKTERANNKAKQTPCDSFGVLSWSLEVASTETLRSLWLIERVQRRTNKTLELGSFRFMGRDSQN